MKDEQKRESVNIGQVDCCGAEGTTSVSVDMVSKHEALGQSFTIKIKAGSRDVGVVWRVSVYVLPCFHTSSYVLLVDTVSCPNLRE